MKLIPLESEEQLKEIGASKGHHVIFKHNTTCPISRGVHSRLEAEGEEIPGVENVYILDLMAHRNLSDAVASQYGVEHQSPQILLIKDGSCTYHEWGYDISAADTADAVKQ